MKLVYWAIIHIYHVLIWLIAPFNKKASLWIQGRKNLFNELSYKFPVDNDTIWMHVSSLGEFEQGRPIIESLKEKNPDLTILLTFFSPSGYEIRKNYEFADFVSYLPLDTPKNARRFLEIVKPKIAIFVKYDLWYYYFRYLHKNRISVFIISAVFRKNQFFFQWYGKFFLNMLRNVNQIFVQNEESKSVLKANGFKNVVTTGDTRFDRVYRISKQIQDIPQIKEFKGDSLLLVGGSTWPPEEKILNEFMKKRKYNIKYILAPHDVNESNIIRLKKELPGSIQSIRYTQIADEKPCNYDVMIIDKIGLLSSIYQYADLAFIGGGFGKSIHNIQEPATFGIPIIIGPNYNKFQEAIDLIQEKGAYSVNNSEEFHSVIDYLLKDKNNLNRAGIICHNYIKGNIGATDKIICHLQQ